MSATSRATSAGRTDPVGTLTRTLGVGDCADRDSINAGASPNPTPVITETNSVNSRTVRSSDTSADRGSVVNASSGSTATAASASPAAPPQIASIRLSVTNWRAIRAAAGAERGPERQLVGANRRARHQQRRDVGAGDQQHAADGRREDQQGGAGRAHRPSSSEETWTPQSLFVAGYSRADRAATAPSSART